MTTWLDRARREIPKKADLATAVTDERSLTAVMAVSHPGKSGISRVSNGGNGSALTAGFREIEGWKVDRGAFLSIPSMPHTTSQRVEREISKSLGQGTAVTDERNPTSARMPHFSMYATYGDNCLPYPERRALCAKQNALYLRLSRRLDKFDGFTTDLEAEMALEAWASDEAIKELYAGHMSWAEHRRLIYAWAKVELAAIRRHRELNTGGQSHAE